MNTEDLSVKDYSISEVFNKEFFSLEGDTDQRYKDFLNNLCQIKPERISEYHAIQKVLCYLAPLAKDMEQPLISLVNDYLDHTIGKNGYDYIEQIEDCAIDLMSVYCQNIADYLVIKDTVKLILAITKTVRAALIDETINRRPFAEHDYMSTEQE